MFTKEANFMAQKAVQQKEGVQNMQITRREIQKLPEELDVTKSMKPDEVSGWISKEYREHMEEPIWDIINNSLKEGKVPRE